MSADQDSCMVRVRAMSHYCHYYRRGHNPPCLLKSPLLCLLAHTSHRTARPRGIGMLPWKSLHGLPHRTSQYSVLRSGSGRRQVRRSRRRTSTRSSRSPWRGNRGMILLRVRAGKRLNTSRHLSGTTKTASTMEWSRSSTSRLPTSDCGVSRGPRGTPPSCLGCQYRFLDGNMLKPDITPCITPPMKGRALHIGPHVHFEIASPSGGPAIENLHLPVIP